MKTVYLLKNNRKDKGRKKIILLIVFCLFVILFCFGKINFIADSLNNLGRSVWLSENYLGDKFSEWGGLLRSKIELVKENRQLQTQLNQINSQLLSFELLWKENIELKELLGRTPREQKTVLANVLAKPNFSPYDSLILDVGKDHPQIKPSDKIIFNNIVLGEIEEVFSTTAKARLYSFPNDKIAVAVGFDKLTREAQGKGGGNFEIKLPRDAKVKIGDLVFLSETGQILGVVADVSAIPEDPFKIVLFKTPLNIFELRWVQILTEE